MCKHVCVTQADRQTDRQGQRNRPRKTETDIQACGQADRQTDRPRQRDRPRERQTDRQVDRQTKIEKREVYTNVIKNILSIPRASPMHMNSLSQLIHVMCSARITGTTGATGASPTDTGFISLCFLVPPSPPLIVHSTNYGQQHRHTTQTCTNDDSDLLYIIWLWCGQ